MSRNEQDLGTRQQHHYFFKNGTMDFYAGWLLGYSQLGALAPGALYHCLNQVADGDPASWVRAFEQGLRFQQAQAREAEAAGAPSRASHAHFAAATAARAALNFCPPGEAATEAMADDLERSFQAGLRTGGFAVTPWDIPFGQAHLPAYVSRDVERAQTVVVVVGGGDTHREDLWYFGGRAALEAGYGVLLCDLPGQGRTPSRGLHFGEPTVEALRVALLALRARGFGGRVVLVGWSGGGLFTAKYVERFGEEISAWVASTPISDMARLFEEAMPAMMRGRLSRGWARAMLGAAARLSPVLDASLRKYEWQFGADVGAMVERFRVMGRVDLARLDVPLLALVGTSEAAEGQRQAREVFEAVRARQPASRLVEFGPESGADAHCQVNNLPLAFDHLFAWLSTLGLGPAARA
ncbi:MAG: alpha/beta hydrolase family protein [Myxococcota bacterium]